MHHNASGLASSIMCHGQCCACTINCCSGTLCHSQDQPGYTAVALAGVYHFASDLVSLQECFFRRTQSITASHSISGKEANFTHSATTLRKPEHKESPLYFQNFYPPPFFFFFFFGLGTMIIHCNGRPDWPSTGGLST